MIFKKEVKIQKDCIDIWSGSVEQGLSFLKGLIPFLNTVVHIDDFVYGLENPKDCKPQLLGYLHSFSWLRDLKTLNETKILARKLVTAWMYKFDENIEFFDEYLMGLRISNIALAYDFLTNDASFDFLSDLKQNLKKQVKLLKKFIKKNMPRSSIVTFQCMRGLFFAGYKDHLLMKDSIIKAAKDIVALRSPVMTLFFLKDILDLRVSGVFKEDMVSELHVLIQALRTFRHGDGKISKFLGFTPTPELGRVPYEISSSSIDIVLSLFGLDSKPSMRAMGFERCLNGMNLVVFNMQESFFEEILSFEWSFEKERILKDFFISSLSNVKEIKIKRHDSKNSIFLDIEVQNNLYKRTVEVFEDKIEGNEILHNKKSATLVPYCNFSLISNTSALLNAGLRKWVLKVKGATINSLGDRIQITPSSEGAYSWSFEVQDELL